jgi:hypothetical protein
MPQTKSVYNEINFYDDHLLDISSEHGALAKHGPAWAGEVLNGLQGADRVASWIGNA